MYELITLKLIYVNFKNFFHLDKLKKYIMTKNFYYL